MSNWIIEKFGEVCYMNKDPLDLIVRESLEQLVTEDRYLLEHDVHEQSISSKLGFYLSRKIPPRSEGGWDVDVEYNRNGDLPKSLISLGIVRLDILIHRRSLNNPKKIEDNNLLIIEMKKNPTPKEKADDIRIVKAFIEEGPYYYCFGAFISLDIKMPEVYEIEWFER
jgi:hypothetical protein